MIFDRSISNAYQKLNKNFESALEIELIVCPSMIYHAYWDQIDLMQFTKSIKTAFVN